MKAFNLCEWILEADDVVLHFVEVLQGTSVSFAHFCS